MPTKEALITFLQRNEALCRDSAENHRYPENAELNIKESVFLSHLIDRAKRTENPSDLNEIVNELKNSDAIARHFIYLLERNEGDVMRQIFPDKFPGG
jgi:putative IMPACT (imprinted ancient) family translation regulator